MANCLAASRTTVSHGADATMVPAMIPVAGDVAGCSWTSSGGELHNGERDDIEPRRRYGDGPGGRRCGSLFTAAGDYLVHDDHDERTPCMRAERRHAKMHEENEQDKTILTWVTGEKNRGHGVDAGVLDGGDVGCVAP